MKRRKTYAKYLPHQGQLPKESFEEHVSLTSLTQILIIHNQSSHLAYRYPAQKPSDRNFGT